MPCRAPLQTNRSTQRSAATSESGVTLVEMLVTLSIAALSAVLIMLTVRPADPLRSQGENLTRALEQLDARARITGKPVGLVLERTGYNAVIWDEAGWSYLPGTQHQLPDRVSFRIDDVARQKTDVHPLPSLVFDPLGHSTLSPVTLVSGNTELTVTPPGAAAGGAQ